MITCVCLVSQLAHCRDTDRNEMEMVMAMEMVMEMVIEMKVVIAMTN